MSWMGHGVWIGIALEDGQMGPKHSSRNVICFGGLSCLGIETCVGPPIET
jgi:hypothetical protein